MTAARKADECDLFSNERFSHFRRELEDKGFVLKLLWSAHSGACNPDTGRKFRYDNVGLFAVCSGQGEYTGPPKVSTVIIVNYGQRDGFGLWLDPGGNDFGSDIRAITG